MSEPARILLVDDQEENLIALEALLQQEGAVLLHARSGREALERLLVEDVALALIDVQMPEMDGFELAELMRGSSRTRDIPIIFVTAGLHDPSRVARAYDSGAVDFLFKPLDPHSLQCKVTVFLDLHRAKVALKAQVADLRHAEQRLIEADRRKDEFLGVLSHELRNPLTPISNSLHILRHVAPDAPQARRAHEVIERQVAHLTHLVDDLLDVTRVTRGKIQLKKERLDLVELVRRTSEDHQPGFEAASISVDLAIPAEPLWVDADPTRIVQALGNLLGNALKFTPHGGHVRVTVSSEAPAGGTPLAVVRVVDDGVGLAPELRERIFEPFTQADRTLDRSRGGLGLGLALVKGVIEQHGGSVHAESDGPGLGASFVLRLPLARGERAGTGGGPSTSPPRSGAQP